MGSYDLIFKRVWVRLCGNDWPVGALCLEILPSIILVLPPIGFTCPTPPPPKQHHHVAPPPTYISVRPLVALPRPFLGQSFVPLKNPSARTIATTNATTPTLPTTFPTTLPTTVSSGRE